MGKLVAVLKKLACGILISAVTFMPVHAVTLGASPLATYIDDEGEPARLNAIMQEAFSRMDTELELTVMRRAFLGSGLLSGKLDGEYAFQDLDNQHDKFVYSAPYLPLYLYATSKAQRVTDIRLIPHLADSRVAVENRFGNTDRFRLLKDIKWSRNPSTYDAFRQLADERAPYLISTRLLIDEFNRLLRDDNEELLHFSAAPLIRSNLRVSLRQDLPGAEAVIESFNEVIAGMQQDGTYNQLLGVAWLTKDTNGDGVAEYISSVDVAHARLEPGILSLAYSLDGVKATPASTFIIDGTRYDNWQAAAAALSDITPALRPSLLDPEVYERMIKRW